MLPDTILLKIRQRLKPVGRIYRKLRAIPNLVHWRNRTAIRSYHETAHDLIATQKAILEKLIQDGIAVTHLDDLQHNPDLLKTLQDYIIAHHTEKRMGRKKRFLNYIWGEDVGPLDLDSPFTKLALDPAILTIVNAYLGMYARFIFSSLNITNPMTDGAMASGSQRWHRDPRAGDPRICKVFLYLNDVDTETGPFEYIRKTHYTGTQTAIFPSHNYEGYYPEAGAVEQSTLWKNLTSCTGRAGTVIFCDTSGLHRGGYSKKNPRTMSTFFYASPSSPQKERLIYPSDFERKAQTLPKEGRRALGFFK